MFDNNRLLLRVLLLGLLDASPWISASFWSALFRAAVLAFVSWLLTRMLTHLLGSRESLTAGLLTLGWIVLAASLLIWLGSGLVDNVRSLMELSRNLQVEGLPPSPLWMVGVPLISGRLIGWRNSVDQRGMAFFYVPKPYVGEVSNWLLACSAKIGGGTPELVLSLILTSFFYRDGSRLESIVYCALERLIDNRVEHYRDLVADTVQQVIDGVTGAAVARALLARIGSTIADTPGAVLLDLLTFACNLLVAPPLVWGPATAQLFFRGDYDHGIFFDLWGFLIVSGIDNILKLYLISRDDNLPPVVVLLGVFGGLLVFGFISLFLNPTLLAVAYNLFSDWTASTPRVPPGKGCGPDA